MTYQSVVLSDNPLVYFRLGETAGTTASDLSGNSRHGTISGSPAPTLGVAGALVGDSDKAMAFAGSRIDLAAASWMQVGTYSVEAWVNPSSVASGQIAIAGRHSVSGQQWDLLRNGSNIEWRTKDSGNTTVYTAVASGVLAVGSWTHVVGTYDGANLRLYINGVLKHTVACSSTLNAAGTSNVLSVAALSSNYANIPWAGSLDEFAYYGTALSAARVASHYVAGTSAYASTVLADTPLAYYRLGETSGTTMLDSSGNSRNGEYDLGGVILGADGLLTGDPNKAIDIKTVSVTGRPGRVDYASWMDLPTFSVEVMFNADSVAAGAKTLVSRYNSTGANDMTYSVRLDGDTVVFYRGIGTAFASVVSSVPVTIGTVHHVVATYDGTTARLYLDGALVGSAAQAAHNVTNQRINIGSAGSAGGGNERFDGRIDEVAIYGTALSGSRVAAHSDASKGVTSAPAVTASLTGTGTFTATVTSTAVTSSYSSVVLADTPTAYYRLGEPAMATQMLDSSGNARHGTYDYTTNPDLPVTGFPGLVDDADTAFRTTISNQGGSAPLSTPVEPFTVDAVIKMPDTAADDTVVIAKRTGQFEFRARWYSTAENPRVMLLSLTYDTDPGGGTTTTTVQSTAMARSKGPMHVAVTHDPGAGYGTNSTTTFYVNGQQVDGSYSSAPRRTDLAVPAGTPLQIGRKIGGEIGAVYLDEVSFYSGKMLTAARIAVHAAQIPAFITANLSGGGLFTATVVPVQARTVVLTGSGSFTATATRVIEATTPWAIAVTSLSPFLWAEFNEASGNTANDSSANGRHGSYSNVVQNQQGLVPGHPGSKAWATSSILSYVTFGSGSLNFPARGSTYVLTYKGTDSANTGRLFTTFSSNTYLDISGTVEMSIGGVKPTLSPVWDPTPLYDGNPHLIVYVVNTTTAELWVDGVMVTSGTHAAAASNLPYVRPKTDSAGPLGTYDEFVLYSSPLTAQQIGTLWTAWQGTPAPAVTASLTGTGTFTATSRAVGAYEGAVLADAPVAYWRMGDTSGTTMADSSGNGRNGTYSNVTLGAAGLLVGDADTSADFNGLTTSSTSGASVPSASWMNPASRSIEAIFRLDALPTTSTATIVARNDPSSGSSQSWQLAIWNDSGTSRPFFHVYDSTGAVIANPTISASVVTGVTYHAVVTYDGATVRVYLNGALVGSAALVAGFRDNGQPITIGRLTGSTFYPFDGRIDEVAIYPTALPASRIVAHYAVSTGIPAVNAPLVGVGSFTATSTQVTLVDNAYDNFNRADLPALTGSLSESGHTWLASSYGAFPSAGIATNRATCNVRDSVDVIETGRTIGEVSIRYIAGQWPAVYARESATGRYRVEVGSGTWYLERDDASTILASWPSTLSSGDVIGLQVETVGGNTVLTVKKNGSALGTYTDSSANQRTGTRFGFSVGLAGGTVDDFSYTSAPVGAVAPQVTAPLVGTGAFTATARKAGPLVAKFDASAITGLVDGDPVVTWVDSVGTSDLTQATSASRPVYRTGVLNGLPVVRFDATDFMDSAVRAVGKYATIVVVAKLEAGSGTRVLAWNGDGNQGSAGPIVSSGNRGLYLRWVAIQTDGAATSNWERWIMPIGASAQKLFVDGTKVVDGSGAMSAVGAGYFRVGGSDGGPEFTSGGMDVAEVRVYDTVLTDAEVAAVDAELAAKWFGVAPTPAVNAPIVGMGVLSATVRKVVSVAAPITGAGALTATATAVQPTTGLPVADDFNRPDSTSSLGATSIGSRPWTALLGTWGISNNTAYVSTGPSDYSCRAVVDAGVADGVISVKIASAQEGSYAGLTFRATDATNFYSLEGGNGLSPAYLYKCINGFNTQIGRSSANVAFVTGDVVSVELIGPSIVVKRNGTTIISATDSTFLTKTKHGLYTMAYPGDPGQVTFDDFSITAAIPAQSANLTGSGAFTATALVVGATPQVAAALTGVGAFTATSVVLQLGDSRSNPFIIGGVEGELTLDMVNMTTESGESLAPGVTRTVWLHYSPPDSSGESVRFLTDSPASVRVYDSGGTLVASDDSGAASLVLPWGTYEIQVGTSTPDSVILEWLDATPMPYNDFANALEINPDYGSEYLTLVNGTVEPGETVPPGTVATSWVTWVAEDTTTLNLTSAGDPADTSYSLIAYSGSPLGEAGSVSGSGQLALAIDMVEGQTYWLQIASSTDLLDVQLVWNIDPVIVEPSQDAESIRAEVYERDGVTLITEVPKRFGVNLQEPLNVTGAGSLSVRIGDETVSMYPDLFDFGNVVKFWLGTRCIHGFRIQNRKTAWVSTDEWSGMVRTVSGPSVHYLLEDFMVLHDAQKLQDRASDVRSFNWAARRGEWYNAEDWDGPYNTSSQLEPPSEFSKPFKKRAKYNNPKNWPDPDALWMWVSNDPSLNEGNFDPPPLRKTRYFRKQFTTGDPYQLVRMYASADEKYQVYLDGEEILSGDGVETGYTEMQKKKLVLKSGVHTLAIVQTSQNQTKADGADAVIFSLMKLDTKGRPTDAIVRSDDSWETTYLRPAPGWNRAQVLRAVVNEAKNRNNNSANHLSLGFTKDRDSRNRRWLDTFNEDVSIGTSALALQGMLSESGSFDVWVDPVNLEIKAWRRRGRDMSHSVTLEPGRNLINWEVEEVDNVKNRFLIQYDGGWTNWAAKYSVQVYGDREAFLTIGKAKNDEAAERIVRRASRGLAQAQARAGTSEIVKRKEGTPTGGMIAVPGARPFLDFGVGDTIKAPNARGILKPHRVLAITLTEDENGEITYDPELEEVR